MQRSTLIPSQSLFVLRSSDIFRLMATFIILSHFLVSWPRLSFVLRLPLHAVPPEHQVLECWCQSRSPSWHGTCIDWHRTPALLWPVPRPLGTLETLYPNSGPPQLLEKENHWFSHRIFLKLDIFWLKFRQIRKRLAVTYTLLSTCRGPSLVAPWCLPAPPITLHALPSVPSLAVAFSPASSVYCWNTVGPEIKKKERGD